MINSITGKYCLDLIDHTLGFHTLTWHVMKDAYECLTKEIDALFVINRGFALILQLFKEDQKGYRVARVPDLRIENCPRA